MQHFTERCSRKIWPMSKVPVGQQRIDKCVLPQRSLWFFLSQLRTSKLALVNGESKTSLVPISTVTMSLTQSHCFSIIYHYYLSEMIFSLMLSEELKSI